MKSLFENITEDEFQTLESILQNPGRTPASFFFTAPTIDDRIEELEKHGLIKLESSAQMTITELGRAALKEHDSMLLKTKHAKHIELLKFLIPTLISLAVLAVSIIALLKT
ncbi:MAG: hypothetical protein KHZ72_01395 [Lachnospiraceae bacterium]|nr:hypothetical protein [Lachnospiraceae bacterium]